MEYPRLSKKWLIEYGFKHTGSLYEMIMLRREKYYVAINEKTGVMKFGVKESLSSKYEPIEEIQDLDISQFQTMFDGILIRK